MKTVLSLVLGVALRDVLLMGTFGSVWGLISLITCNARMMCSWCLPTIRVPTYQHVDFPRTDRRKNLSTFARLVVSERPAEAGERRRTLTTSSS